MRYFRCLYWLSLPLLAGCEKIYVDKTETPLIEKYVKRHKLKVHGKGEGWQERVYSYSEAIGPKFNEEEMREFTAWRVK